MQNRPSKHPTESRRRRSAPALRQRIYVPARLRALLHDGLDAGMVQIQAPAGCGKTALILQFLIDRGSDPHWYTCTHEDTHPASLLSGVLRAIGAAETTGGQTALAAIASRDVQNSYAATLAPFVSELAAASTPDSVLVIDDADAVALAPAAEAIDYLISALAPRVSVILISRAELPLPSQARRLLDGTAVRLTAEDLLLREDEIAEFAREAFGLTLADAEIATLYRATAGWAIALRLVLRLRDLGSPITGNDRAVFSPEARRDLFAYLTAEILSKLDTRIATFVRRTAILESLDPPICARLTGEDATVEIIQSLAAAGLPVMKAGWSSYRCHSLLREYMLATMSVEELRDAHAEAGRAYLEVSEWPAALEHFGAADDVESALSMADEHGREIVFMGHGRALLDLVRDAHAEFLVTHYRAHYWAAFAAARTFQLDWAAAAFDRVHENAASAGDTRVAQDALRALAQLLNSWGRYPTATAVAQRLLDTIPGQHVANRAATQIGYLVTSMGATSQFREAIASIRRLLPDLAVEPRADAIAEAYARAVAAATLAMEGDFTSARGELHIAKVLTLGREDDDIHTFVPWSSALVEFVAAEPDRADEFALVAEKLALQFGDLQRVLECRALRAATATMRGNVAEADEAFARLDALRGGGADYWGVVLTLLSRPERARLHGALPEALAAAESNHALAVSLGGARFVCSTRLDITYFRLLTGNTGTALEHARLALNEAIALDAALLIFGANLMLAASSRDDEVAAMADALRIAEERDYRFLMPYGVHLRELDAALWRALDTPYASRAAVLLSRSRAASTNGFRAASAEISESALIIAVAVLQDFGTDGRREIEQLTSSKNVRVARAAREALTAIDAANPHRLSGREREVLDLLCRGLRTKDIAERLVLTPATISTHIQRIMSKTGTLSRAELLALAARESQLAGN